MTESNVYDDAGNRRRTTIGYTSFGLPSDVYEYEANATTVLRRTHTDYNLSSVYTNRRIIGLPSAKYLYDGNNTLFSKVTYEYDLGGGYQVHQVPLVQHDTVNYGPTFIQGRGNLNVVRRWDVTDPGNLSKSAAPATGYNTSGSVIFTRDALGPQTSFSYTDSFSDSVNHNTLAYPTTVTDPDNFSSTVQYNYDFGAVTRSQDPKGAVVTRTYDAVGRLDRITNQVNNAYTRFVYTTDQKFVNSFTTIKDLSTEFYSTTLLDGYGRVRAEAADHPTSVAGYKVKWNTYDAMGRLATQTNWAEINSSNWDVPVGDDVAGFAVTQQAYDWQGRPTVFTNQDGTTKEISYGGCGCAGGSVMTVTDEGTVIMVNGQPQTRRRQKKVYHDILARVIKTQDLNWEGGAPYSTNITTYNVRDQITSVKEYSGDATGAEACPSGACQKTEMNYDGHGRLWKQRRPIEAADNVYLYNNDDTLWRKTDPLGINSVYSYNNRGLVTGISYDALPNAVLPSPLPSRPIPSSSVSFGYDEAGNRIWMDDGPGRVDYVYDQLSRLKEEIRLFDVGGVTRSFTLKYEYNLAGQLKQITDPWNSTITYNRNKAGQETGVTGTGYKDYVQPYTNHDINVFASNIQYRAWGGIKQFTNGSRGENTAFARGYDARMRLNSYTGNGRTTEHDYYNDGLIKEVRDLHYGANFLRKYEYDHAGRLTKSHAGGSAQTSSSPYSLTYGHDVWGNSTLRQGSHWSQPLPTFSATYVNNRDTNMTYDAAGNVKVYRDTSAPWIHYNATNQLFTELIDSPAPGYPRVRENYYDGNGVKANYIDFTGSNYTGDYLQDGITYLICSSVLGGKVIAEFRETPSNIYSGKSYVYLNGVQLAIQEGAERMTDKWVYWIHHNPVVGNLFREQNVDDSSGQNFSWLAGEMTFDPTGNFVGISEPEPIVIPDFLANFASQLYEQHHNDKCYADGVLSSCNLVFSALNNGYGAFAPWDNTTSVWNPVTQQNELALWTVDWDNGFYGFVPTGAKYNGDGTWGWNGKRMWSDDDGEEGDGKLFRSSGLSPAVPITQKVGFGRVIKQDRDTLEHRCWETKNGIPVNYEVLGIWKDVTTAEVIYSPIYAAPPLVSRKVQPLYGRYGNDARGHIVGRALGGDPVSGNLFSQNHNLVNNAIYKSWEYAVRKTLTEHKDWTASLNIELIYNPPAQPEGECKPPADREKYFRPIGVKYGVTYKDSAGNVVSSPSPAVFPNPK